MVKLHTFRMLISLIFLDNEMINNDSNDIEPDCPVDNNIANNVNRSNSCVQPVISSGEGEGVGRSQRVGQPPSRLGEWVNAACSSSEPICYHEAISGSEKEEWVSAMKREIDNMKRNNVY